MIKIRTTRSAVVVVYAAIVLIVGAAGMAQAGKSSSENGRIVFARRPAPGQAFEIYIRRTDGTQVRLTTNSVSDYYPDWSPDYSQIVFRRTVLGNQDLYVRRPPVRRAVAAGALRWSMQRTPSRGNRAWRSGHAGSKQTTWIPHDRSLGDIPRGP